MVLHSQKTSLYFCIGVSLCALGIMAMHASGFSTHHAAVSPLYSRELAMLLRVMARSMHLLSLVAAVACLSSGIGHLRRKMPAASITPIVQGLAFIIFASGTQEIVRFVATNSLGINPFV